MCLAIIPDMECETFDNPADFFLDKVNEAENDLMQSDPGSEDLLVVCILHNTITMIILWSIV